MLEVRTLPSMPDPRSPAPPLSVRPAAGVFVSAVDGELVLMSPVTGSYYSLDRIGRAMWETVVEHGRLDVAAVALERRYAAGRTRIEDDLTELVTSLEHAGLVEVERG